MEIKFRFNQMRIEIDIDDSAVSDFDAETALIDVKRDFNKLFLMADSVTVIGRFGLIREER